MTEHLAQLARAVANPGERAPHRRRFVEAFIRPLGAEPAPAERVVAMVEELAARSGRR